jgi:hypothetical protein
MNVRSQIRRQDGSLRRRSDQAQSDDSMMELTVRGCNEHLHQLSHVINYYQALIHREYADNQGVEQIQSIKAFNFDIFPPSPSYRFSLLPSVRLIFSRLHSYSFGTDSHKSLISTTHLMQSPFFISLKAWLIPSSFWR